MNRALSVLFAVLVLSGCSSSTGPSRDLLSTSSASQTLEIRNNSSERVYFFVADRGMLALLNFAICNEPDKCESISSGDTRRISYGDILGYTPESREVVVYHWRLIADGAEKFKPDLLRSTVVELR